MMSGDEETRIVVREDDHEKDTTILPGRENPEGTLIGKAGSGVTVPVEEAQSQQEVDQVREGDDDGRTLFVPLGSSEADAGESDGPLVGWLVVLKGPGRGKGCPVYYGQNSIGRGPDQRVRLDFGDQRISRDAHAYIIYDDADRKFFIRDNGKSNPVRHNGEPVMMPKELSDRDVISMGDSTLMFVALCGSEFDWLAEDGSE